ncbi:hypothetical protein DAETH_38950 (plasmid) [Deinococcus aetherius]|uniref:Na(+) H(+) antiporter subunit E n=1 Tax=Deinococcus aetherius TaxID=200252 RepID=A0ABM8AJD8_9DEIO|nr:Na+/H+ antiporter subunit E [Deinococcus aetherius]BDP43926.1 hypothetical protein DAETH_38950 [Deinococcus aetherius]
MFPRALGTGEYVRRMVAGPSFLAYFLQELTVANVQVALFALRRCPRLNSMIVAVPLRVQGDLPQTLLATTLTLMPSTVVMGFSPDRRTLYAHAIGTTSAQAAHDSIRWVEDRLMRVLGSLEAGA